MPKFLVTLFATAVTIAAVHASEPPRVASLSLDNGTYSIINVDPTVPSRLTLFTYPPNSSPYPSLVSPTRGTVFGLSLQGPTDPLAIDVFSSDPSSDGADKPWNLLRRIPVPADSKTVLGLSASATAGVYIAYLSPKNTIVLSNIVDWTKNTTYQVLGSTPVPPAVQVGPGDCSVVGEDGNMFCSLGTVNGQQVNSILRMTRNGAFTWFNVPQLDQPDSVASDGSFIYVAGPGKYPSLLAEIGVFNPQNGEWRPMASWAPYSIPNISGCTANAEFIVCLGSYPDGGSRKYALLLFDFYTATVRKPIELDNTPASGLGLGFLSTY